MAKKNILKYYNFSNGKEFKAAYAQIYKDAKDGNFKANKNYQIQVIEQGKTRSLNQNSLWWVFMNYIAKKSEQGYTAEQWHLLFRANFLQGDLETLEYLLNRDVFKNLYRKYTNYVFDTDLTLIINAISKSTTKLSTKEFNQLFEQLILFAGETLEIELVMPDNAKFNDFSKEYLNVTGKVVSIHK